MIPADYFPILTDDQFSKKIQTSIDQALPPRHLICHIAVLFVLTVLDPACPLSMEGETVKEKKYFNNSFVETKLIVNCSTVFVSA